MLLTLFSPIAQADANKLPTKPGIIEFRSYIDGGPVTGKRKLSSVRSCLQAAEEGILLSKESYEPFIINTYYHDLVI